MSFQSLTLWWNTFFNRAIPTPTQPPQLLIVPPPYELMGANCIQTTTPGIRLSQSLIQVDKVSVHSVFILISSHGSLSCLTPAGTPLPPCNVCFLFLLDKSRFLYIIDWTFYQKMVEMNLNSGQGNIYWSVKMVFCHNAINILLFSRDIWQVHCCSTNSFCSE